MADGNIRIKELEEITALTDNDYVATDNSASGGETKKFKLKRLSDSITELAEDMEEAIDGVIEETDSKFEEALALGTTSGSIATFTDGSTLPMRKLEVAIEPQQDLHGYDNPWVGGSGKNKLPNRLNTINKNGITITKNSNGTYTVNGTCTADNTDFYFNAENGASVVDDRLQLPNGEYKLSGISNGTSSTYRLIAVVYNPTTSYISLYSGEVSFTIENNVLCAVFFRVMSGQTFNNFVISPMIRLASVADATFAPYSNICPISGWDECKVSVVGKNLLNVNSPNVKLGYYINSRTGEEMVSSSGAWDLGYYIKCMPNTSYYLSGSSGNVDICFFDKYKNYISGVETYGGITTPNNCFYIRHDYRKTEKDAIQLEEGSTATAYEPYNGQTYTIDLDGTRYGGKLDVVSGLLTVDRGYVDLGNVEWTYRSNEQIFQTILDFDYSKDSSKVNILSCYQYNGVVSSGSASRVDKRFSIYSGTGNYLWICDLNYTDTTLFKNSLSGQKAVLYLATPQTIQLTPTEVKSLLATNNVFADTGDILDATYVRNANITINDLIRRIEALES